MNEHADSEDKYKYSPLEIDSTALTATRQFLRIWTDKRGSRHN